MNELNSNEDFEKVRIPKDMNVVIKASVNQQLVLDSLESYDYMTYECKELGVKKTEMLGDLCKFVWNNKEVLQAYKDYKN